MPRLSEPMRDLLRALATCPPGTGVITTRGRAKRGLAHRAAKNGWVDVFDNERGALVVVCITPAGREAIGMKEGEGRHAEM